VAATKSGFTRKNFATPVKKVFFLPNPVYPLVDFCSELKFRTMKKIMFFLFALSQGILSFGQNNAQKEAEVRAMEFAEVQALLHKDIPALQKIWSPGFMVNAPLNMVFIGGQVEMVRAGIIDYVSFIRTVDQVMVLKDVVITMGSETVVPAGADPMAGQTVQRRYTNIWMKERGDWVLMARHANNICPTSVSAPSPARNLSESVTKDLQLKLIRNPSHHNFQLQFPDNLSGRIYIEIMDSKGSLLENLEVAGGRPSITFGDHYSTGIYYARITNGTYRNTVKLVKL
jgi:hypothetical protein